MQTEALWQIPDPDYDRHPAYGAQFGVPSLGAKLPPGVHKLRLENKEAGISEMVTVTINPGKKTSLTKRFKP